jgi:protein-tyrosine kinase
MILKELKNKDDNLYPAKRGKPTGAAPTGRVPETPTSESNAPGYSVTRTVDLDYDKLLKNRCVCFFPQAPELGYYKFLRTKIMHQCKAAGWNTIMVTSALPGEGKTLTAINLAVTLAKAHGQTAMLVDCDLRRQTVHHYLGVTSHLGLTDYLKRGIPIKDLIIWPGVEKFTFISGGEPVYDSAELISSPKMAELSNEMKVRYADRYIFFDTPPLLAGPDSLAFTPLADCIIMVVHPKTSLDEVNMALELIPQDKFLGFVLNQTESLQDNYYQKYQYESEKSGLKLKLLRKKSRFSLPDLSVLKWIKK